MDPERYLAHIGHHGPAAPTAETLAALQRTHLLAVPFNALDCLLGNPVTVDPLDAYRKVVGTGRGGFCFELNGLFAWLLEELGFRVSRLAARPFMADGSLAPPFAHLALLVEAGGRHLVDVGFGFPFAFEPLDIDDGSEQERGGRRYRVAPDTGDMIAEELGAEHPNGYRFSLEPVAQEAFAEQCRRYSTDPESGFVRRGAVVQAFDDGWVNVTRQRISGRRGGVELDRALAGEEDWRAELRRWFGLVIDGSDVRRLPA